MQYMGGKSKIARHIVPLMNMFYRLDCVAWVEPFMGSCNTLSLADGVRYGNDKDADLVSLFKALQEGYEPPDHVSEELYRMVKAEPSKYSPELRAFISFGCSFGGKKWGGYARGRTVSYASYAKRSLRRKAQNLVGVVFTSGDYKEMHIPRRSFIYCDPPYSETTSYGEVFNHQEFWEWCRCMSNDGHTVLISEYSAPSDFTVVTSSMQTTTLDKSHLRATEYIYRAPS